VGAVVGTYLDPARRPHGFVFQNGQYTPVDFPGAIATEALGMNNKPNPSIVGDYTDAAGLVHGFVLKGGIFTSVDAPFAANLAAYAINDREKIVGIYNTGGPLSALDQRIPTFGFTGSVDEGLSPLSFPITTGGVLRTDTLAASINNRNDVV